MKRDIDFSELTPLNFKSKQIWSPPIRSLISLIEIITAFLSVIFFTSLQDFCEGSYLFQWYMVMLTLVHFHLIITAIENLYQKIGTLGIGFQILDILMMIIVCTWIGIGHFLTFVRNIDCYGYQDFFTCCALLTISDITILGALTLWAQYYFISESKN